MHQQYVAILGGGLVKDKVWRTTNYTEGDLFGVQGDRMRVLAASYIYQHNPSTIFIILGGKGQLANIPGAPTVASVIAKELIDLGIPKGNIVKEEKSATTFQQLFEAKKIIDKKNINSISFISNSFHLPRIRAMIKHAPQLPKLYKNIKIKYLSAEQICLKYDKSKWQKIINKAMDSQAMLDRLKLERKGVRDIKQGKYKFKQYANKN